MTNRNQKTAANAAAIVSGTIQSSANASLGLSSCNRTRSAHEPSANMSQPYRSETGCSARRHEYHANP